MSPDHQSGFTVERLRIPLRDYPAGISINATTGVISGTFTTANANAQNATITATAGTQTDTHIIGFSASPGGHATPNPNRCGDQ